MPKKCYGVAENDLREQPTKDNKYYALWFGVLTRCFRKKLHEVRPTYSGATICDEWLKFSNFSRWAEKHYLEGTVLDKDILVPGNKHYSPENCVFVPAWVNTLFSNMIRKQRPDLPMGVYRPKGLYIARFGEIAIGSYETAEEAHLAYKSVREREILKMAELYSEIPNADERVVWAMIVLATDIR